MRRHPVRRAVEALLTSLRSPAHKLPLIAVVAYGLFNLVLVIIKIVRFNTYPQEYKSLLEVRFAFRRAQSAKRWHTLEHAQTDSGRLRFPTQDIKAARKEFKGKGIMED